MNSRPIETSYKNYRFRSRLEARYARFFDAIVMKWDYEKEGYNLGNLGAYLPDFWLPFYPDKHLHHGSGEFLEVKGEMPTEAEINKLQRLSEITAHNGILVWGIPGENSFITTHRKLGWRISGSVDWDGDLGGLTPKQYDFLWHLQRCFPNLNYMGSGDYAFGKARSARFEWGESGVL